jgi:hypothetical protein
MYNRWHAKKSKERNGRKKKTGKLDLAGDAGEAAGQDNADGAAVAEGGGAAAVWDGALAPF